MEERQDSNSSTIPASTGVERQPAATESHDTGKFFHKGAQLHKWSTYLGIDWLFNTISGVTFAYFAKYTDTGQKYWSQPITKAFTKLLQPVIKDEAQLNKSAAYGNMFMSIIAGGMFTMPPLLVLENKKVKKAFVKFYDRLIYGKERAESDPQLQKAYEEIDNEPKKDFTSGMLARFAALAPLLATVLFKTSKEISGKLWFNHIENGAAWTATKAGFTPEKAFNKLPASEAAERWNFIKESFAMDFGLGIPYAVMHAFFYKMFSAMLGKKGKDADVPEPPLGGPVSETAKIIEDYEELPQTRAATPAPSNHAMRETVRKLDSSRNQAAAQGM